MHLGVLDYISKHFYIMLLSELSHPNQLHGLTVSQLEEIYTFLPFVFNETIYKNNKSNIN